jgi:ElaA protein
VTDPAIKVAAPHELDVATLYALLKVRVDVFVVEQECPYPELDDRDLESGTRHVWVESPEGPLAYLRILDDGDATRIGRVLVLSQVRGSGVANRLMEVALDQIGDRPSVLDAQSYLERWYTRFGYVRTGDEFVEDGIPHVPMRRDPQVG